jgi:hypothetical protein
MMKTIEEVEMLSHNWALEQYSKIQDFVINNKLYIDQPLSMSHADIVIELAKKTIMNTKP